MVIKIFQKIFFVLIVLILQISFIPNLGWIFCLLNIVLLSLIFIGIINNFQAAFIYALIMGPVLDLYGELFFPAITICLLLTLALVRFIFLRVFTNRSYYSVIFLTALALIIYNYLYNFLAVIFSLIHFHSFNLILLYSKADLIALLWQILINVIFISIIFAISYFLSNKFQSGSIKK